ncbi:MAG: hypothetical protein ACFFAO_06680 [Candidatus Hermodarchaeota archaeon]
MEKWVKIPDKKIVSLLKEIFGDYKDIMNFPSETSFSIYSSDFERELLSIIERHPMRHEQLIQTFKSDILNSEEIEKRLLKLENKKRIKKIDYDNQIFWKLNL